eukprot:m.240719 g.240719  ORF g.240719 m.240719 type:complete len:247 (-) comp15313_c0_seq9:1319-2059(-)
MSRTLGKASPICFQATPSPIHEHNFRSLFDPASSELEVLQWEDDVDDEIEPEALHTDDEDSNEESHWRNDYPEEESFDSEVDVDSDVEDHAGYRFRGVNDFAAAKAPPLKLQLSRPKSLSDDDSDDDTSVFGYLKRQVRPFSLASQTGQIDSFAATLDSLHAGLAPQMTSSGAMALGLDGMPGSYAEPHAGADSEDEREEESFGHGHSYGRHGRGPGESDDDDDEFDGMGYGGADGSDDEDGTSYY